jgi:superfamily II DNA or RNA helicase
MKIILGNIESKLIIGGPDNRIGNTFEMFREYLRYRPDGYFHNKLFKLHKWDGYNYLLSANGTVATGYVPMIIAYAKELGLQIEIIDRRINRVTFKKGELDVTLPKFSLADHQIELVKSVKRSRLDVEQLVGFRRGIWDAATNSGKTAAFAALLKNINNPKAILLVSNESLYFQHIAFFETVFPGGVGRVGKISDGAPKTMYEIGNVLTIAMLKTLNNLIKKDMKVRRDMRTLFNVRAYDEGHESASTTAIDVLTEIDADLTLCISGTPLKSAKKDNSLKLIGLYGPVLHKVTKKYLMDKGISLSAKVKVYTTNKVCPAIGWEKERTFGLFENQERAELIADLIHDRPDKKILVMFSDISHGEFMFQTLLDKYPQYLNEADITHGKDKNRSKKLLQFIESKTRITFASQIWKQGINISDINTIIYAIGHKAEIWMSQIMGRGERLDGVSEDFEHIDIFDRGSHLSKHSRLRIKFYKSEGLDVQFMYPAKKDGTPI